MNWKEKLHEIIYEADTPHGKLFDIILIFLIIFSVGIVMLESVESIGAVYHDELILMEWIVTILFTLEYILRIICIKKPFHYILSFYGIIDFLATIPLYLSYLFVGTQVLIVLRVFRLLRVFRILKLVQFIGESTVLLKALQKSRAKIAVFIYFIIIISITLGTIMYLVEGEANGFTSIPRSIYWTIVTMTTVGYGDIAPQTALGQLIATLIMVLGYGIIAVPTGIVTVAFNREKKEGISNSQSCKVCAAPSHLDDANYCYKCGAAL